MRFLLVTALVVAVVLLAINAENSFSIVALGTLDFVILEKDDIRCSSSNERKGSKYAQQEGKRDPHLLSTKFVSKIKCSWPVVDVFYEQRMSSNSVLVILFW